MVISDAPAGAAFRVVRVTLAREVGKRLADMGFTEGAEGAVIRGGFLRGPFQVRIRGYDILIRRCEAAGIEIEPVGNWSGADGSPAFGRVGGRGRRGRGGRGHGARKRWVARTGGIGPAVADGKARG